MLKKLLIIALLSIHSTLIAATLDGITLSDSVSVSGKKLVLNGMGTRKATWFKVKVYVGGLYLLSKSNVAQEVLKKPYPKFINMHFVRDVGADKLIGGWNDAFKAALGDKRVAELQPKITAFNNLMGDIKEGEEIHLSFLKDGVKVKFANKAEKMVAGEDIAYAVLSVWFINAADEGLRDGFLGIK
jgi:hypothetical protein